jgi:hypothetical protein
VSSDTARILSAVANVWPRGPEHFGAEWPDVRKKLLAEIARLESHPHDADATLDAVLALFDTNPAAREDLVVALSELPSLEKGEFKPLPGQPSPIEASRYRCPDAACDHEWTRRSAGQKPGKCPTHHLPLVPRLD